MIFPIQKSHGFPPVEYAEPDGLLGFGGDLSVEMLMAAYERGIFPWYNPDDPILWWSPDPRPLFTPGQIKVSKSLKQVLRKNTFTITFDQAFAEVLKACASVERPGQDGTWLTWEMEEAYISLHQLDYCHSVEVWRNDLLVGGLYGVIVGKSFVGESMFHKESNASKVGFYYLSETLKTWDFHFIDGQVSTPHLLSLGAIETPRSEFIKCLEKARQFNTHGLPWKDIQY
jgi:leucyl/phenylalanyl-tRNA--protein transferase